MIARTAVYADKQVHVREQAKTAAGLRRIEIGPDAVAIFAAQWARAQASECGVLFDPRRRSSCRMTLTG